MATAPRRIDENNGRYLPVIYPEERPYWDALRQHKLVLPRCKSCAQAWFPLGPACPNCFEIGFDWSPMTGKGVLHNYVVYHKAWAPWLEKRVPYAVVQVELDEGPRLTTNLLECPIDQIKIGMRVEAMFEDITDDITLLQFRPASS